jgi:hypothetical protein
MTTFLSRSGLPKTLPLPVHCNLGCDMVSGVVHMQR